MFPCTYYEEHATKVCRIFFRLCRFDHSQEFVLPVTEELLDHCAEGALSIEVYGHRRPSYKIVRGGGNVAEEEEEAEEENGEEFSTAGTNGAAVDIDVRGGDEEDEGQGWTEEEQQAKARSLADRYDC